MDDKKQGDLFPKPPSDEKGFHLPTWGGFEIVLPENLVTPNTDFAKTAPPAEGKQKRRAQRRRKQSFVTGVGQTYEATGGTGGIGGGFTTGDGTTTTTTTWATTDPTAPATYVLGTLGTGPLADAIAEARRITEVYTYANLPAQVNEPRPSFWSSIVSIAGAAVFGLLGRK